MSRTKSSIKNLGVAMIGQFLGVGVNFIARIFFLRILGNEYLGINGLFTNILTVLSLAELGVGTAITYSLYKPLAEDDKNKCKMLMQLYKKIYIVIGCVILLIGVAITPLIHIFIKDVPDIKNLNLIYILFVLNTSVSYFFSYKRNLIIADQNRYIATIYRYGFYTLLNFSQIIYLVLMKDYIGFLILQIIATVLENLIISKKADKMYQYLTDKDKVPLDEDTKKHIIKNTKAMMMHKIGGVVVTSTDNIILSSFVSVVAVGIYSNYFMIINALNIITGQVYNSLVASIGNLCASDSTEKQFNIFKNINFLTFWIFSFSSICLITLFNPFITMWIGSEYLFGMDIVLVLVINFYITGMRKSSLTFREATGLFYQDRWKAIFESVINLVMSILLVMKLGIIGVFLGTFISSITTCIWIEPYVLYKYCFKKDVYQYFSDYLKKMILTISLGTLVYLICTFISGNIYLVFFTKLLICLLIPNVVFFLIYRKTDEFKYLYEKILKKLVIRIFRR